MQKITAADARLALDIAALRPPPPPRKKHSLAQLLADEPPYTGIDSNGAEFIEGRYIGNANSGPGH